MGKRKRDSISVSVWIEAREFVMPPVRDCVVIGKRAPIGSAAMKKALSLLHRSPFEDLHPKDDVIDGILVRASILRKIPAEKLRELLIRRLTPLMDAEEILHLQIDPKMSLEEQL